jgi:hypothetical protein
VLPVGLTAKRTPRKGERRDLVRDLSLRAGLSGIYEGWSIVLRSNYAILAVKFEPFPRPAILGNAEIDAMLLPILRAS